MNNDIKKYEKQKLEKLKKTQSELTTKEWNKLTRRKSIKYYLISMLFVYLPFILLFLLVGGVPLFWIVGGIIMGFILVPFVKNILEKL